MAFRTFMKWYRSLYWRIALGVVAFLAAMLVVQAVLFVWAVSQSGRSLPGQSPARLGQTVALDLTSLLEREPQADLAKYVRDQYATYAHPFFVLMSDGRFITSGSKTFPDALVQMARARLQGGPPRFGRGGRRPGPPGPGEPPANMPFGPGGTDRRPPPFGPEADRRLGPFGPDGDRRPGAFGPDADRRPGPFGPSDADRGQTPQWWQQPDRFVERLERDAGGAPFVRPAPIVVAGKLAGVVVVPPQAPFGLLLSRYAPMLTVVGGGVLVLGTVLTSVLIFGPARRRLRAVEGAARRFGSGDLAARAPEKGGDEIAAVATAFNRMADDLATSDRVRRQLLADVSHELNTPVTAVRGYLETLTMPDVPLDDSTRARYLHIIADETARLERLIGDLLDLAKFEGGGGTFKREPVEVDQLFERVAQRHERELQARNIELKATIERDAQTVVGDADRLEQVLQNLAANGLRYAPDGSTIRLVATASTAPEAGVTLAVEDEGPGIDAAHLPHVFDRFYKADTSRTPAGGSGLGLSIVKTIVERHGGRIAVVSRPGRTVFEVWLPAQQA
jgi:signal transduction histidine kinase